MDMDGSFQCGVLAQFLTPLPVRLPFQKPGHVLSVACGKNVLLVVSQDHATGKTKVYASGFNRFGQLGNGMASEGFQYELLPVRTIHDFGGLCARHPTHTVVSELALLSSTETLRSRLWQRPT
jgi:alpha-tubulin suppressor-like RCC1 family protein